ncbi:hypothetical protein HHI36_005042 [Cryptolaemus montrouzieri]|uniref:Uncharacterized protein n=1 Tax=Cryptolaemus montrouzieri TaxID=559131 RepID=A0ABD2NT94_9CUCU
MTRYRIYQQRSLLDLILTSDFNILTPPAQLASIGKSDDVFLTCELQLNMEAPNTILKTSIKTDFQVNERLEDVDWLEILSDKSVNDCWEAFVRVVNDIVLSNSRKFFFKQNPKNILKTLVR